MMQNIGDEPMLCLILFLHQTTTLRLGISKWNCCVLFYFYIKPQLGVAWSDTTNRCVLFYFYIKPQPLRALSALRARCVLFYFYIKPQLCKIKAISALCCVLFYFYIKPQLDVSVQRILQVVSYSISTSNHNSNLANPAWGRVVSYSISTSNHN